MKTKIHPWSKLPCVECGEETEAAWAESRMIDEEKFLCEECLSRKEGYDEGYKDGKEDAKKENEESTINTSIWEDKIKELEKETKKLTEIIEDKDIYIDNLMHDNEQLKENHDNWKSCYEKSKKLIKIIDEEAKTKIDHLTGMVEGRKDASDRWEDRYKEAKKEIEHYKGIIQCTDEGSAYQRKVIDETCKQILDRTDESKIIKELKKECNYWKDICSKADKENDLLEITINEKDEKIKDLENHNNKLKQIKVWYEDLKEILESNFQSDKFKVNVDEVEKQLAMKIVIPLVVGCPSGDVERKK